MSEHDNYSEQDIATVTLTLDNDETVECAILTIYEVDGHKYIALLPLNEEGESEDGDVYLYRFIDTNPNEPELENTRSPQMLSMNGWMNRSLKN